MSDKFLEYLERVYRESIEYGIPSIDVEEGYILYGLAYGYVLGKREHVLVVDAGAGIGYSTLWLALGLYDAGCRECIVEAVEKNSYLVKKLEENLVGSGLNNIEFRVYNSDAVEFVEEKPSSSINILFVDIEKHRYPEILLKSLDKVDGMIVFHNALFPPPPRRLYELLDKHGISYRVLPTENGLLIANP